MKKFFAILILACLPLFSIENEGYVINFSNVSMYELIKFISKTTEVNFVGDQKLLDFEVSFITGKPIPKNELLEMLFHMLEEHDLEIDAKKGYYLIKQKLPESKSSSLFFEKKEGEETPTSKVIKQGKFNVYKLQYHQGSEILTAIKQIANDLISTGSGDEDMVMSISSMQWIKSTNSLFFSGPETSIEKLSSLISSLDTPLKQVFIEVLVIETNISNSLDFGLKWSLGSKYKDHLSMRAGNMEGEVYEENNASLLPFTKGFDLGIIGDIISHKGKSFLSLSSLVSALQSDGDCSIVLNQKIIAQENKNSEIFVGNNLPFAGAIIQTTGSKQQTTANIEYKDVGVMLNIMPLLGSNDIITLEIKEEITEALDHFVHKNSQLSGIKTSKTNMSTSVHVPDGHFLILSGMTRNVESTQKSGIPCLGGLPMIGSLFHHKEKKNDKSNLLIFVRPHIIQSHEDYESLSATLYASQK